MKEYLLTKWLPITNTKTYTKHTIVTGSYNYEEMKNLM